MVQHTLENLEGKTLLIECEGDLELIGTTETDATVEINRDEDLTVKALADRIVLVCDSNADLSVPADASVHIVKVRGDAVVRSWTGPLEIDRIGGDLVIQQVAGITVHNVGGDCSIVEASGPVQVDSVGGDFSGSGLAADVTARRVGSDFHLTGAFGNVTTTAGSDIRLSVAQLSGQSIVLRAGSDVRVNLPPNPDVSVRVTSGAHIVKVGLRETRERYNMGKYEAVFGSGAARLEITAGSDVSISDGTDRTGEMRADRVQRDEHIARKTEKALRKAEQQLARAERQAVRSSQRGQDAVRLAQERVQAAMQRLEARRQGGPVDFDFTGAVASPGGYEPESPVSAEPGGVTEEERMLILQMLQEKKITVEEADRLLSVLEGNQE